MCVVEALTPIPTTFPQLPFRFGGFISHKCRPVTMPVIMAIAVENIIGYAHNYSPVDGCDKHESSNISPSTLSVGGREARRHLEKGPDETWLLVWEGRHGFFFLDFSISLSSTPGLACVQMRCVHLWVRECVVCVKR